MALLPWQGRRQTCNAGASSATSSSLNDEDDEDDAAWNSHHAWESWPVQQQQQRHLNYAHGQLLSAHLLRSISSKRQSECEGVRIVTVLPLFSITKYI